MRNNADSIAKTVPLAPGRVIAVAGASPSAAREWCARLARDEDVADSTALLSFSQQTAAAMKTGWPQARYYTDGGETVAEFLSYNSVYDINPFEIGAKRPETKKSFRARLERIARLLDIRKLADRPVIALSNGETRRVLLARALAKGPKTLVLDDPAAGLDRKQRERLKSVVAALAKRGMSVVFVCRHADEVPDGADWYRLAKAGRLIPTTNHVNSYKKKNVRVVRGSKNKNSPPVVEIKKLNLSLGGKTLFTDFSWTVRRGERWILRGENGSGKTTLMALVTGDSPLAYAADIRVFGQARETGVELAKIRRRIAMVSPEMQASYGADPETLLSEALRANPRLLILDEPFLNLGAAEARKAGRRLDAWLKAHPETTAILICHRDDEAPRAFTREMPLSQ